MLNYARQNKLENQFANAFFFSVFFVALRVGESVNRIPTQYVFILFSIIFFGFSNKKRDIFFYGQLIIIPFFILLHFFFAHLFQEILPEGFGSNFFWFIQYFFLFTLILYFSLSVSKEQILSAYLVNGKYAFIVVYITFVISIFLKKGIGADYWSNGWIRPHGLFSEPSNLCYLLPGFMMISILNKNKKLLIFTMVTMLIVMSPTVYGVALITFILYLIVYAKLIVKILLSLVIFISTNLLVLFGGDLYKALEGSGGILTSIQRLIGGVLLVTNNDPSYANARVDLALGWSNFVSKNHNVLYCGLGLGVSNSYTNAFNDGMTFDTSIILMLINSFGILISAIIIILIIYSFYRVRSNKLFLWVYISLFIGTIFNPSGVYYQYTVLVFLFISMQKSIPDVNYQKISN